MSDATYRDATGHTVHPSTPFCPNCRAFNIGRRCSCTVAYVAPRSLDSISLVLPVRKSTTLVF